MSEAEAWFQRRWSIDVARRMPVLERHATALHRLGPRCVLEFALEVAAANDCIPDVAARLADYAELTPAMVRAAGGHRFPRRRLVLVPA